MAAYIEKVRRLEQELLTGLQVRAERLGADVLADIKQRVVQTGQSATGAGFSPYSEKPVPAFFYRNKSRNASAERELSALAKAGKPVSYKQFRQINGLNTGYKNFEFTGAMWRNVQSKSVQVQPGLVSINIQGSTAESAALIGYHTKREGVSIIKPSPQELTRAKTTLLSWLKRILQ